MRKLRLHIPKIRNEFCSFRFIHSAEVRPATMKMQVDMEHGRLAVVGSLKRFANRVRSHHRSHPWVIEIVPVRDFVQIMGQYDHAAAV
jgi:hypothetical protein